jgi:DNA-binding Xre family transcriptional regulator
MTKLEARMKLLGYRMTDVAREANVNRWHLNDYIHYRKHITPLHLQRLCDFLQCEPEAIYE